MMKTGNDSLQPGNLKPLPYGVSDFAKLRRDNSYFVDKTAFIKNVEAKGRYLFFIRPRRFGKSLLLSILQYYYDINSKDDFDELFGGTAIGSDPTDERNSYLMLSFDFSAVGSDISTIEELFHRNVRDSIHLFIEKYRDFLGEKTGELEKEINSDGIASGMLNTLLVFCRGKGLNIYVTIDEYDNFANTILSTSGERKYHDLTHGEGFFRAFFNVLKSSTGGLNAPISRLFVTGVSPITMDDVTSGFNIGKNISLTPDITEILGLTREEVEEMIDYYREAGKISHSTGEILAIMSAWYNGYKFSMHRPVDLFNTTQVLYFIDQYMETAGIPGKLIDRNFRIDYNKLRHLVILDQQGTLKTNGNFSVLNAIMEKGEIHSEIETGFPAGELTEQTNFISLLYYFGLLTIDGKTPAQEAILKIPNETVRNLYYDYISTTYKETGIFNLDVRKYSGLMSDMAFKGEYRPLFNYLERQIESAIGLRDLIHGEKAIQVFLNVYLGLSDYFTVYPEKELNMGFADLVLEPFSAKYPALNHAYVIEIKYTKPVKGDVPKAAIEKLKREAKEQLNRYSRDERFKKRIGNAVLKKIALVFSGHRLADISEC